VTKPERDRWLLISMFVCLWAVFIYATRIHDTGLADSAHDDIELVLGVLLGLIMGRKIDDK
jgi:hypothetical protein